MLTKDRVGAAAVILAAIIGLWLVFSYPQSEGGDDDDDARAGQETSQVDEAPGGQLEPVPGGAEEGEGDGDDDD
ncbi:MAG TPA: hypothetical protein VKZ81_08030 [Pseudonocardia sp.]|uniref:hypothetical protein n=1 Tax=Pseudonocardia sp. TaxID=60912 RepID=UPI002B4AB47B|nr:hypothetical protein [Pseudonocardia sp.]HLU55397.1 hypothetical protein [Pseudonocardia sp.]